MPRGGARLLEGGPIATEFRQAVSEDVAAYRERHGRAPVLAVVICGRDAPSMVYLGQILRSCEKVGIDFGTSIAGICLPTYSKLKGLLTLASSNGWPTPRFANPA